MIFRTKVFLWYILKYEKGNQMEIFISMELLITVDLK